MTRQASKSPPFLLLIVLLLYVVLLSLPHTTVSLHSQQQQQQVVTISRSTFPRGDSNNNNNKYHGNNDIGLISMMMTDPMDDNDHVNGMTHLEMRKMTDSSSTDRHVWNFRKKWLNCTLLPSPETTNMTTKYFGFGCSYIALDHFSQGSLQEHWKSGPIFIYQSQQSMDLCKSEFHFNETFCHQYFCNGETAIELYGFWESMAWNQCLYCKDSREFEDFHYAIANGTCKSMNSTIWMNQFNNHCRARGGSANDEADLITYGVPLLSGLDDEWYCYCQFWDRIGWKCDFLTHVIIPYTIHVEPFVNLSVHAALLLISIWLCVLPSLNQIRINLKRTDFVSLRSFWESFPLLRLTVVLLVTLSQLLMTTQHGTAIKASRSTGTRSNAQFFSQISQSLYRVVAMAALYAYLTLWVQILYKSNQLDTKAPLTMTMRIILTPLWLLIGCLLIFDTVVICVAYFAPQKFHALAEPSIFIIVAFGLIQAVVTAVIQIYGLRLYFMLRKVKRVSWLQTKFTRMMSLLSIHALITLLYIILSSIQSLTGKLDFYGRFVALSNSIIVSTLIMSQGMLLVFSILNWTEVKRTYGGIARFFLNLLGCSNERKRKPRHSKNIDLSIKQELLDESDRFHDEITAQEEQFIE